MPDVQDLFGGTVSTEPPPVPPVWMWPEAIRERIVISVKPICGHCMMTGEQLRRMAAAGECPPAPWSAFPPGSWQPQRAMWRITQTDGSTLDLCARHAKDHANRGSHHG